MFDVSPNSSFELVGKDAICKYLSGGKGIVTLKSPTGVSRTYSFQVPRYDRFPDGTMFIYARISSGIWQYIGMLDSNIEFRLTRASHYPADHPITKGAAYIVNMMNGRITSTPMKLYHGGTCSVCGRRLTSINSIIDGMGRTCRRRWMESKKALDTKS